jgi:tricarballylate dehydrogenase
MDSHEFGNYDVLVIGGGCAALSSAITAREHGASVLLLEVAPKHSRAGNSRHTRNMRLAHETTVPPYTGPYPEEEMWENYIKATGGVGEQELAKKVVSGSSQVLGWMMDHGVRFQPAISGTLHLGRTNAWFLGGGKAMMNSLYDSAEELGVDIRYEAEVVDLDIRERRFHGATVIIKGGQRTTVTAKTVIVAAGGFQSNPKWLKEAWGPPADNFLIRGTPYDTGTLGRILLDNGADSIGDPTQAHMVPIDARSPKYDGGIVTRLDCVTLGVVVNKSGKRFYDEGEDFWPMRYAIWGRLVAQQEDQIAYAFIDAKTIDRFMPSVFPAVTGNSVAEVAEQFNLPVDVASQTIEEYNQAVQPGKFDHTVLDGCKTEGLEPSKTNWAQKIDQAPFYGYPLRPGLTFTYYGIKINLEAEVLMDGGNPAENIWAAGEIMAGNILPKGYIGGVGLVLGNIYGRTAGENAAALAKKSQNAA